MGTKRRKGAELPVESGSTSLLYTAAERLPPPKAPRTAAATAAPSAARRFGFKGPSISQVTSTKTRTSKTNDHHSGHELSLGCRSLDVVDTNTLPSTVDLSINVLETFSANFNKETLESLEQLLAFRHKTNKFAVKARKEEQIAYIKQLKAAVKDVVAKVQEFSKVSAAMDDKLTLEKATLERRLAVLQQAAKHKGQSDAELRHLREQLETMKNSVKRLKVSEEQVACSNATLRDSAAKLEIQLEEVQTLNTQLKLELKSCETRMQDQSRHYEEKAHEMEQFFEKKGMDEDKRNHVQLVEFQEKLSKAHEEIASVHKELENLKGKAIESARSLNDERERRTKAEMANYKLEATNQSLEARVKSGETEMAELKEKIKRKDEEVSNLVKSLTEIQKLNASTSTKLETEKKELLDKMESLQLTIRNLERNESANAITIRDLRKQLELETKSRTAIEQSEQLIRAHMKKLETELQESSQKVGVEGGVRQILEDQVRELRTEHVAVNAQMEAMKAEMKRLQSANVDSKEQHNTNLIALEAKFQQEKDNYRRQIDKLQEEKVSLGSAVKTLRERASTVRDEDLEELCEVKREADVLRRRLNELTSQGAQSIAQKDTLISELQEKVKQGDKMRRAMHNTIQSSRSHSVFTLHLQGVNDKDGVMLKGQLNLVDLAGSERASRSNVSGDRLKETQAINKSLSCLADVFNAIGNKASHIPFRNSKLTYLLQSSLSGDGKTLMMVNLSPTLESASESLCSLRFAKQVNQCELGKPKRQIKARKGRQ
ncbi:hypothetical protein PHYBOEH_004428 [Phytophthora boehmeriae]|uniref:Kinesin-like protein n=1 Tax=Phytophthora boehmeriae TaxID=109152 RepID=A0A8T1WNG7_9STRA|nr:hypothetical protein PHYBOEH_004428 [Phytophthora boehmeriae]